MENHEPFIKKFNELLTAKRAATPYLQDKLICVCGTTSGRTLQLTANVEGDELVTNIDQIMIQQDYNDSDIDFTKEEGRAKALVTNMVIAGDFEVRGTDYCSANSVQEQDGTTPMQDDEEFIVESMRLVTLSVHLITYA